MQNLSFPTLSTKNIIILLTLIVILLLVYLKNNNFELFTTTTTTTATTATTTIPLLNNDFIQNSALTNFINSFIVNKNQQNLYISSLSERQNNINKLSSQVINLINPTA